MKQKKLTSIIDIDATSTIYLTPLFFFIGLSTCITITPSVLDEAIYKYGTIFPESQAAYIGSQARIVCFSILKPRFTKNGGKIIKNIQIDNSLVFNKVKKKDGGFYTCNGTKSDGNFSVTSKLYVGGMM